MVATVLGAGSCGNNSAGTSAQTEASLNVTPCNYARVWHDDPSQFVEFATVAHFARSASSSALRSEGQRLATAEANGNAGAVAVAGIMSDVLSTCERLGLVHPATTTSTTKG
jgi:hypothetical protein